MNGSRYEGQWSDDKWDGQGVLTELTNHYKGAFKAGKKHGKGV